MECILALQKADKTDRHLDIDLHTRGNDLKGFLPAKPPLKEYSISSSPSLSRLQEIASNLPKLLLTSRVQLTVESLKKDDLSIHELLESKSERELKRAMVHLSCLAHAYVLEGTKPNS